MFSFLFEALWGSDNADPVTSRCWHIISVRPRHEKKVHEELVRRGIESFQPMVEETRQWSDRKTKVAVPLFPGYDFVHINVKERLSVLGLKGVLRFVAVGHRPVVVPDEEVRSLQLAVASAGHAHAIESPGEGVAVMVNEGPLAGIRGIVTRSAETTHVVIPIESLHTAVAVDVEDNVLDD